MSESAARFSKKSEAILQAAAQAFNEQGLKGATLADIAERVGLVTTGIAYYYRRKEDLAAACFLRAIQVYRTLVRHAVEEGGDMVQTRVERLLSLHAELVAAMQEGRHSTLIEFRDLSALPDASANEVFDAYTQMFREIRSLLCGTETQALGREALNARTHLLVSIVHWTRGWLAHHDVDEYGRVIRCVVDTLLHGVTSAEQDWTGGCQSTVDLLPPPPASPDNGDAFLRAATILVNEQGYRGASVEKISARLHVTKGSFYHHHDTKQDLITASFERSFAIQRHVLRSVQELAEPGGRRARAATETLVRFQISDRGPLLRTTAIGALPDDQQRKQVQSTIHRLHERIAGIVIDGLLDGSVRPQNPTIASQWLWAGINAAVDLRLWVPGISVANVTKLYTRPLLNGLLCAA